MPPVNCRQCGRYALVLDGHYECAVCREKRIPITGQLLEGIEPEKIPASSREEYRQHHARVFGTGDMVNNPPHYNQGRFEVIDIIEAYFPDNYHLGNALKYLLRAPYKGHEMQDLRKLVWYVERYIGLKESLEDTIPDLSGEQGDQG